MSNYYTILTQAGAALHADAQVQQTTVPWTHIHLGDGNGAPVIPSDKQTCLVHQVHVLSISDIAVHPDNPNWVIAEAVVPSDVGGWTVRETAIYGGADSSTCIAVGNYPETYKPVLAEGVGREMVLRMVVEISSAATVTLQIDPSVAIASRAWVESLVATPDKAGLVKLATIPDTVAGERADIAVTPEGLHAALGSISGLPRYTPYIWGGRADSTPAGDTQSSGQQLLDLMYPNMRAEVVATQFTCPEAEWQADPYKRITHWSLGDGNEAAGSWMRCPDKNGVQPGNLGTFYGTGANPAGFLVGAAVDAEVGVHSHTGLANVAGEHTHPVSGSSETAGGHHHGFGYHNNNNNGGFLFKSGMPQDQLVPGTQGAAWNGSGGGSNSAGTTSYNLTTTLPLTLSEGGHAHSITCVANKAGAHAHTITIEPYGGRENRPRTWYGIWMIRMYGRVLNAGALDAPALNARMDLIDARVSALEVKQKALVERQSFAAGYTTAVTYTNSSDCMWRVEASTNFTETSCAYISLYRGSRVISSGAPVNAGAEVVTVSGDIPPGETWRIDANNHTNLSIQVLK